MHALDELVEVASEHTSERRLFMIFGKPSIGKSTVAKFIRNQFFKDNEVCEIKCNTNTLRKFTSEFESALIQRKDMKNLILEMS